MTRNSPALPSPGKPHRAAPAPPGSTTTMRFLLAALLCSSTTLAATTSENVAKDQALRNRLNTEFIVVGDAAGMSQPADERWLCPLSPRCARRSPPYAAARAG